MQPRLCMEWVMCPVTRKRKLMKRYNTIRTLLKSSNDWYNDELRIKLKKYILWWFLLTSALFLLILTQERGYSSFFCSVCFNRPDSVPFSSYIENFYNKNYWIDSVSNKERWYPYRIYMKKYTSATTFG
jgi:hypothetical protein